MKKPAVFLIHVVSPIVVGASIYLGWRSTSLLVFRWIEAAGADKLILRSTISLPDWILYSLPDGCWVYAYTSWMLMIWGRMAPWVFTGVILAAGAELGQLLGSVPGSYDNLDMSLYFLAFILAGVIHAQTSVVNGGAPGDGFLRIRKCQQ